MDASHASDKADLLRMSEQRFQMVWELASDAMTLSTADGIVIAANPAYFRLYGYAPEMVLGQSFSVIFPEEERSWAEKLYQIRYRSPVSQAAVETTVRRADGSERIVEASYTFLEEQGRKIAMLSIIRDITEHKQREEQLRENGLKLQMARELVHHEARLEACRRRAVRRGVWVLVEQIHMSRKAILLIGSRRVPTHFLDHASILLRLLPPFPTLLLSIWNDLGPRPVGKGDCEIRPEAAGRND